MQKLLRVRFVGTGSGFCNCWCVVNCELWVSCWQGLSCRSVWLLIVRSRLPVSRFPKQFSIPLIPIFQHDNEHISRVSKETYIMKLWLHGYITQQISMLPRQIKAPSDIFSWMLDKAAMRSEIVIAKAPVSSKLQVFCTFCTMSFRLLLLEMISAHRSPHSAELSNISKGTRLLRCNGFCSNSLGSERSIAFWSAEMPSMVTLVLLHEWLSKWTRYWRRRQTNFSMVSVSLNTSIAFYQEFTEFTERQELCWAWSVTKQMTTYI